MEVREGAGAGAGGAGACYVLREGGRAWVWCGASATGDEREVAKNMAATEHALVMQGKHLKIRIQKKFNHENPAVDEISNGRVSFNFTNDDSS